MRKSLVNSSVNSVVNAINIPRYKANVATDNCTAAGSLVITQCPRQRGTLVGTGVTGVTITVKDASGNSSICTANFTVNVPVVTFGQQ